MSKWTCGIALLLTCVAASSTSPVHAQTPQRYQAKATTHAQPSRASNYPVPLYAAPQPIYRWGYFGARHFAPPVQWHRGFSGEYMTWKSHR